jgi:hypothetical protein
VTKRAGTLLGPLAGIALAAACATQQPAIPYCTDAAAALPPAAPACASEPEARRVKQELSALAVPEAHWNLVRVAFDGESRVDAVCVERARYTDGWNARVKLSAREAELRAVAPGPACLAGTSLELNRLGARRAQIDVVAEDCRREATASALPVTAEHVARVYRVCIEREQIQRGEIWMLEIGQVYVRAAEASDRRAALTACTQDATPIGRSGADADSAWVYADPATVTQCLRGRGWVALD